MKLGPKYKIARRLKAPIFEKTQTQKFALRESQRAQSKKRGRPAKTGFGMQLLEKQKARLTYGLSERQFSRYVAESNVKKGEKPNQVLFEKLETRLDNTVYRLGLAPTRQAARQMVSHGHITVDGKRVTIPSFHVSKGMKIKVRAGSLNTKLFDNLAEKMKTYTMPNWLKFDENSKEATVLAVPILEQNKDLLFDLNIVLEFYSR